MRILSMSFQMYLVFLFKNRITTAAAGAGDTRYLNDGGAVDRFRHEFIFVVEMAGLSAEFKVISR